MRSGRRTGRSVGGAGRGMRMGSMLYFTARRCGGEWTEVEVDRPGREKGRQGGGDGGVGLGRGVLPSDPGPAALWRSFPL